MCCCKTVIKMEIEHISSEADGSEGNPIIVQSNIHTTIPIDTTLPISTDHYQNNTKKSAGNEGGGRGRTSSSSNTSTSSDSGHKKKSGTKRENPTTQEIANKKKKVEGVHQHHHRSHHSKHQNQQPKTVTNAEWLRASEITRNTIVVSPSAAQPSSSRSNVISEKQLKEFPALTSNPLKVPSPLSSQRPPPPPPITQSTLLPTFSIFPSTATTHGNNLIGVDDEQTEDFDEHPIVTTRGGRNVGGDGLPPDRFPDNWERSTEDSGVEFDIAQRMADRADIPEVLSRFVTATLGREDVENVTTIRNATGPGVDPNEVNQVDLYRQNNAERLARRLEMAQMILAPPEDGTKRILTPGQKRLLQLLQQPKTDDDLEYIMRNDTEEFHMVPVKHPVRVKIDELLGPEVSRDQCWGCATGVFSPIAANRQKLQNLTTFYIENRTYLDDWEMAIMLEMLFETTIRRPVNSLIRDPAQQMREWTARSIYDHFTEHNLKDPTHAVGKIIEWNQILMKQVYDNMVYRVPVDIYSDARRPIHSRDIVVHPESLNMYLKVQAALFRAFKEKPQQMFGFNASAAILDATQSGSTFAPKQQRGVVVDMKNGTAGVTINPSTNSVFNPKHLMRNS